MEEPIVFEGHAPGGFWGKVSGGDLKSLFVVIIMALMTAGLWLQADSYAKEATRRDADSRVAFLAQHTITQALIRDLIVVVDSGQRKAERASTIQNYILTLNEKERKELQLNKPDELKRR